MVDPKAIIFEQFTGHMRRGGRLPEDAISILAGLGFFAYSTTRWETVSLLEMTD